MGDNKQTFIIGSLRTDLTLLSIAALKILARAIGDRPLYLKLAVIKFTTATNQLAQGRTRNVSPYR